VSEGINELEDMSLQEKDAITHKFFQRYVNEQIKEESRHWV